MQPPVCANFTSNACPMSNTYVESEKEIDGRRYYGIRCRTCGGLNVWPSDSADNAGRYDSYLKKQAEITEAIRQRDSRKLYFT